MLGEDAAIMHCRVVQYDSYHPPIAHKKLLQFSKITFRQQHRTLQTLFQCRTGILIPSAASSRRQLHPFSPLLNPTKNSNNNNIYLFRYGKGNETQLPSSQLTQAYVLRG
mmetsp:Transcript_45513/g.95546  ORF Transcript_45513/g.95546 Transcript_45513/m.95546 type:complete len:110 (-) Transcript_45513:99-428(-)